MLDQSRTELAGNLGRRSKYSREAAVVRLGKIAKDALPEEVRTPGGRRLDLEIVVDGTFRAFESGAAARRALHERDIEELWVSWKRPQIEEGTVGVVEHAYGVDPVSRKPLFAYGVYGTRGAVWRNTREAAEQEWDDAQLAKLRAKARVLYYADDVRGLSVHGDLFNVLYSDEPEELERVIERAKLALEVEQRSAGR